MTDTQNLAKRSAVTEKQSKGFSADEKAAMKERAKELKAATDRESGERDLLAKIAEMPDSDRVMAERIHAIVTSTAPDLWSRTWYGMPAYTKDGKIVCFFKSADKFKSRYATLGFEETANLDDGSMWATSWALTKLTATDEAAIRALVKKAAS